MLLSKGRRLLQNTMTIAEHELILHFTLTTAFARPLAGPFKVTHIRCLPADLCLIGEETLRAIGVRG
jgi:hypothetical protein